MQIITSQNPIKYAEALENMHKITDKIISGEMPNTIWFLEHEPIYTVGYTTYKDFSSQYGESINGIPYGVTSPV